MGDDLVKRLLTPMNGVTIQQVFKERSESANEIFTLQARIEVLIAERDEAWKRASHAEKMWALRSAKLLESEALFAKAMKALQEIKDEERIDHINGGWCLTDGAIIARTTIEELTK